MIKHVFIDFDGTLINSLDSMYRSYIDLLKNYEIKGTKNEFDSLNGPSTREIVEILKEKYQIQAPHEEILAKYKNLIEENYIQSKPFEDSELFLSELQKVGIQMTLVTSSHSEMCLPIIKQYGWDKYFDSFQWGESVQNSKPNPEIYLNAIENSKTKSEEIFVIEDSINGVRSGASAGLKVLALSNYFSEKELLEAGSFKVFQNLSKTLFYINSLS